MKFLKKPKSILRNCEALKISMKEFFFFNLAPMLCLRSFPGGTSGKEPACQCRRHKRFRFDPWVGKIPGGGHGNSLQYSPV